MASNRLAALETAVASLPSKLAVLNYARVSEPPEQSESRMELASKTNLEPDAQETIRKSVPLEFGGRELPHPPERLFLRLSWDFSPRGPGARLSLTGHGV